MKLTQLLDRYVVMHNLRDRTVENYRMTIDRFRDYLKTTDRQRDPDPTLCDLDDFVVASFLRWRAKTPHRGRLPAHGNVLKDRTQLVALWNYAAKKRLPGANGQAVEFPSLPRMSAVRHVPVAYKMSEIEAIITVARQRQGLVGGLPAGWWWSTICRTAFETGERLGGLQGLTWRHVDLDGRRVVFLADTRKGRCKDILRPISEQLAAELAQHKGDPNAYVWPWDRAKNSIWASFRILCTRAGVSCHGFHGFRKSHASYVAAAGGNAQAALDHENAKTTQAHYLDPTIVGGAEGLGLLPPLRLDQPHRFHKTRHPHSQTATTVNDRRHETPPPHPEGDG
jgi:integrase